MSNYRRVVYEKLVDFLFLVDEDGVTHVVLFAEVQQPGQDETIVRGIVQLVQNNLKNMNKLSYS